MMRRQLLKHLLTGASALTLMLSMGFALPAFAEGPVVGKAAPAFSLPDADGKMHNLADYKGKIVVLEWTNPDCPFVVRHYKAKTMTNLADKYKGKDVVWLAVNSTHYNKPADSKK